MIGFKEADLITRLIELTALENDLISEEITIHQELSKLHAKRSSERFQSLKAKYPL